MGAPAPGEPPAQEQVPGDGSHTVGQVPGGSRPGQDGAEVRPPPHPVPWACKSLTSGEQQSLPDQCGGADHRDVYIFSHPPAGWGPALLWHLWAVWGEAGCHPWAQP